MNRLTTYILYGLVVLMVLGCKKKTIDFTYSPTQPCAGKSVAFSNHSDSGEDWFWTFGDNATSSVKSPTHIYKQPGTYTVTLKVDDKNMLTRSKQITIYDTIPSFSSSFVDTIGLRIYEDASFRALVYNPYSYNIEYLWQVDKEQQCTVLSEDMTSATLRLYFLKADTYRISLRIVMNGDTTLAEKTYEIQDYPSEGVLMRNAEGDYRQRIYGVRSDAPASATESALTAALDAAQDSAILVSGEKILVQDIPAFEGITWDGVATANRRLYLRSESEGIYVAFMDGSQPVCITTVPTFALLTDITDNRLYWATADSVMYLPLIDTPNNNFTKQPIKLNNLQGVKRLAKDNELR